MTLPKSDEQSLVEIWFKIEKDSDGYPESKDWEGLLASRLGEHFKIESVPFYLKSISRGDIVEARRREFLEYVRVVRRGGSNTYRLLLKERHHDDPDFTINELKGKGLQVEQEHGMLLAVDVPPSVDQSAVDAFLIEEKETGRWELQDGYVHSTNTERAD